MATVTLVWNIIIYFGQSRFAEMDSVQNYKLYKLKPGIRSS